MSPAPVPSSSGRFLIRLGALVLPLFVLSLLWTRTTRGQGTSPGPSYYCGCYSKGGAGHYTGADPVDLWSGKQLWQQTDLSVDGLVPMELVRYHSTLNFSPGPFGPGTSL